MRFLHLLKWVILIMTKQEFILKFILNRATTKYVDDLTVLEAKRVWDAIVKVKPE